MTSVYDNIMTGLNEAVDYAKGNKKSARVHTVNIEPVPNFAASDIRDIRSELGMTQMVFATVMGVSKKTVEAWEEGINTPNGPSCRLLEIFRNNPGSAKQLIREA